MSPFAFQTIAEPPAEALTPALFMFSFLGSVVLLILVGMLSYNWRKARVAGYLASLKSQMIGRGMSAEEIERVLAAGAAPPAPRPDADALVGDGSAEAQAIASLGAQSYGSDDIAKVCAALARHDGLPDAEARKLKDAALVKSMAAQWMDADDMVKLLSARSIPDSAYGAVTAG
ncbi:MAG TPA: hypothetical protein VNC50_01950 [Planctomycetia bacterium]|nr:hypothetical protein [Planctomycetia bacterium]